MNSVTIRNKKQQVTEALKRNDCQKHFSKQTQPRKGSRHIQYHFYESLKVSKLIWSDSVD